MVGSVGGYYVAFSQLRVTRRRGGGVPEVSRFPYIRRRSHVAQKHIFPQEKTYTPYTRLELALKYKNMIVEHMLVGSFFSCRIFRVSQETVRALTYPLHRSIRRYEAEVLFRRTHALLDSVGWLLARFSLSPKAPHSERGRFSVQRVLFLAQCTYKCILHLLGWCL